MRRRGLRLLAALCACMLFFVLFGVTNLLAAQNIFKRTVAASDPAAMQAQMASTIKKALTAKEWSVYVIKEEAAKNRPAVVGTDVLTFTDRTVISKNLAAGGYSKTGSNYALRVGPDGLSVWETMQVHENEKDLVFLRGELPKDCSSMIGSMVYQSPNGAGKTENFSTSMPAAPAPEVITSAAQGTSAAVTTTSTGTTRTTTRTTTRR